MIGSVAFVTYMWGFHGGVSEEHTISVFGAEEGGNSMLL
jgi:hypothetical protein